MNPHHNCRWALIALFLLLPATAPAVGVTTDHCVDGMHHVDAYVFHSEFDQVEVTGVVFLRSWIGVCRPEEFVPAEPIPFDPAPDQLNSWVKVSGAFAPPTEGVVFKYQPFAVMADGSRQLLRSGCASDGRSYTLASCGEAPLFRAFVAWLDPHPSLTSVEFAVCSENCWGVPWGLFALTVEEAEELSGMSIDELMGTTIDFFGDRTACPLLGGPYFEFTDMRPVPDGAGCGSVPNTDTSWGSLKARYR